MFHLGPFYTSHSEHWKYADYFWRSLDQPICLSLRDSRRFDPARYYTFGTLQHFTEVTSDQIADIRLAMLAAREIFLYHGLPLFSNNACESDLRTVLGHINYDRGSMYSPFGLNEVIEALRENIERGNLIFIPRNEDLRKCVKSIQDERSGKGSLGHGQPFKYVQTEFNDDATMLAARGVNEAQEAECFAEYELDMRMCSAGRATFNSPAYYIECKARAFQKYQQCRGY